jgi:putative sterol carrier protein
MAYPFPSKEWLEALCGHLNQDERYQDVARNWEGDMIVVIEADGTAETYTSTIALYLDLWHGACRSTHIYDPASDDIPEAAYTLLAPYKNIMKIFTGELDPVQAMLTRRLQVQGNMAYMLRNIPVVLDFVRCCRLIEIEQA